MNKPLLLFVGPSGCGKTTVAQELEKQNYKTIQSYTTRNSRYDGEIGHVFISEDEFDALENIVAHTQYNGHRYCTTKEQLDESVSYVVDIPGVETLLRNYDTNRTIFVFYFDTAVTTRIDRMLERGDSDTAIVGRLRNDEAYSWFDKLDSIVWQHNHKHNVNVELHRINANKTVNEVIEQIQYYIEYAMEVSKW